MADFCLLLTSVGKLLDNEKGEGAMAFYFETVDKFVTEGRLIPRIKFAYLNVVELRKHDWVPRREVEGPKTIKEVHQDHSEKRK